MVHIFGSCFRPNLHLRRGLNKKKYLIHVNCCDCQEKQRNKENVVIRNFQYKHKSYERDGFISNNSIKIKENASNFLMDK